MYYHVYIGIYSKFKDFMKWVFTYISFYKNQYCFHLQNDRKKPDLKILNTTEVMPPQR